MEFLDLGQTLGLTAEKLHQGMLEVSAGASFRVNAHAQERLDLHVFVESSAGDDVLEIEGEGLVFHLRRWIDARRCRLEPIRGWLNAYVGGHDLDAHWEVELLLHGGEPVVMATFDIGGAGFLLRGPAIFGVESPATFAEMLEYGFGIQTGFRDGYGEVFLRR